MNNTVIIIATAGGGIIGLIISIAFSVDHAEKLQKVAKIIAVTLISSILPFIATVTFYLHAEYNKIDSMLEYYINPFTKAYNKIDNLDQKDQSTAKKIFIKKLENISGSLSSIVRNDEIIIEKDEILNTWTELITTAENNFYATNLVPEDEWKFVSKDSYGIKTQNEAQKRGVDVRRINLYDNNDEKHKIGIENVHKANLKYGIPSLITSIDWVYDNPTFNYVIKSLSTADIVIVDDEILLLTIIDRRTYDMDYARLCFNKNKIETAKKFFNKLWYDLEAENNTLNTKEDEKQN